MSQNQQSSLIRLLYYQSLSYHAYNDSSKTYIPYIPTIQISSVNKTYKSESLLRVKKSNSDPYILNIPFDPYLCLKDYLFFFKVKFHILYMYIPLKRDSFSSLLFLLKVLSEKTASLYYFLCICSIYIYTHIYI